jgi:hypothetical protein
MRSTNVSSKMNVKGNGARTRDSDPLRELLLPSARKGTEHFAVPVYKIVIIILALFLISSLSQGGPLLPRVVGAIVNLCIMAAVIQVVISLQRSLH